MGTEVAFPDRANQMPYAGAAYPDDGPAPLVYAPPVPYMHLIPRASAAPAGYPVNGYDAFYPRAPPFSLMSSSSHHHHQLNRSTVDDFNSPPLFGCPTPAPQGIRSLPSTSHDVDLRLEYTTGQRFAPVPGLPNTLLAKRIPDDFMDPHHSDEEPEFLGSSIISKRNFPFPIC